MTIQVQCEHCKHEFPITSSRCPHCARPGRFPNVELASLPDEVEALDRRYDEVIGQAERRDSEAEVLAFEAEAARSKAVIARSRHETKRLATSDHEVYATYHQLTEIEFRIPGGDQWHLLRNLTDLALFGDYMKEIRFAALSLDGLGLMSYGDYAWGLREEMIAHRASVFEENSVMFMDRMDIRLADADQLPAGHRATWADRAMLCVAKLASRIDGDTTPEVLPELLLRQGRNPESDAFVEVHVGGPMTVRTLERIIPKRGPRRRAIGRALEAKLERNGVEVASR